MLNTSSTMRFTITIYQVSVSFQGIYHTLLDCFTVHRPNLSMTLTKSYTSSISVVFTLETCLFGHCSLHQSNFLTTAAGWPPAHHASLSSFRMSFMVSRFSMLRFFRTWRGNATPCPAKARKIGSPPEEL